jgi:hypothetical protein
MSHTKALLILCPDMLTAWNSRFAFFTVHWIDCKKIGRVHDSFDLLMRLFFPAGRWFCRRNMISQSSRMSCNCVRWSFPTHQRMRAHAIGTPLALVK